MPCTIHKKKVRGIHQKGVPTNKIANSKQRVGITHQKVAHIHTKEVRRTPLLELV
jgi:hypothetical protein